MGVRVQLSTHLSARVVYTADTPTSLCYMDTPTSLYDGGAYTGGCIRVMGIFDGSSMHSPSLYTTQCMRAYGEAHTEGGARTPISMTSQDTGKGVTEVADPKGGQPAPRVNRTERRPQRAREGAWHRM